MSGNEKLERELESFLREDGSRTAALYRKLPRPEPDASLDAAVLAMARRAVASAPPASPARRAHLRWIPVLSAAAVVALAVGISYRLGPQMWAGRKVLPAAPPAASSADEAARQGQAVAAEESPARRADMPAAASAPAPAPPAGTMAPKPAAPSIAREQAPAKVSHLQSAPPVDKKSETAIAQDAKAFPSQAAPGAAVNLNAEVAQPVRAEPAAEVAQEADLAKQAPATAPPAPPARSAGAPASAAAAATSSPAPQAFGGVTAPAGQRDAIGPKQKRAPDSSANLYPEHWLQDIHQMLREGHRDAALQSLAEFRKRYPDYRLPDDLRDLK